MTVLLFTAAVPCLPLRMVSTESLARARDYALLGGLAVASLACVWAAPPFAPIGLWLLWWWRAEQQIPTVVSWLGLAGLWLAVQSLPPLAWLLLPWAWLGLSAIAVGVLGRQWWALRPPDARWWQPYRPLMAAAWFGQRTVAACLFALVLPFAPWWALPIPLAGLWLTSSWVAILAALGGAALLTPGGALLSSVPLLAVYLYQEITGRNVTPRGASLDSLRQRGRVTILLLAFMHPGARMTFPVRAREHRRGWWPWGYGPRSMETGIITWAAAYGVDWVPLGHAHVDILQFLWEYGLPGVAAAGLLLWQVGPHLRGGDPWSAAWVAGVLLGLGSIPYRAAPIGLLWLIISAHLAGGG